MKIDEYVDLDNKDTPVSLFLIWSLIAGVRPFEVLIRKSLLSLLRLDHLKDFLDIKYVNSY